MLGIIVQFVMFSKKQGKKDKQHLKTSKKENSMESEVERARKLLDEDDDDDPDEYLNEFSDDEDDDDDIEYLDDDEDDDGFLDIDD